MDDRRALMAACIANPDEDTPRLALADWLQEHGDKHDQARAEFIRLQIQCANVAPDNKELWKRAKELVKKHRKKWLAPLGLLWGTYLDVDAVDFSRGFLSSLFVEVGPFLSKRWQAMLPDALATVGIEGLYFWSSTQRPAALATLSAFCWVAKVDYPNTDDTTLATFARAENFAHLSELVLSEARITDAGLRDFAKHTRMSQLKNIMVEATGRGAKARAKFTAKGILALLKSDRLSKLTSLEVGVQSDVNFGLRAFFKDEALKKLERLSFAMEVSATEIVACPYLTNLRVLQLHEAAITDADAEALLSSPTFKKLEELYLIVNEPLSPATQKKLKKRFGDMFTYEQFAE